MWERKVDPTARYAEWFSLEPTYDQLNFAAVLCARHRMVDYRDEICRRWFDKDFADLKRGEMSLFIGTVEKWDDDPIELKLLKGQQFLFPIEGVT